MMTQPPLQSHPRTKTPEPAPAVAGPRLLLVVIHPHRRQAMLDAIAATEASCQVEVVDSVLDGMARSTRMPAHFLVIDVSVDRPVVPALVRYLARVAPQATVHTFEPLAGQARNDSLDSSDETGLSDFGDDNSKHALAVMRVALKRWLATQVADIPTVQ